MTRPGLEPWPLDPESSTQSETTRPLRLPLDITLFKIHLSAAEIMTT